jgi:hypothetical protein
MWRVLKNFNPIELTRTGWAVATGGGPRRVRIKRVSPPSGWLFPTVELELEVTARNGRKERLTPTVPLPLLLGWTYVASRRLGAPVP